MCMLTLNGDAVRQPVHFGGAEFGFVIINENMYMVAAQALYRSNSLYADVGESMTIFSGLKVVERLSCENVWLELDIEVVVNKFYSIIFSLSPFDVICVEALSLIYRLNIKGLSVRLRICNKVIHNVADNVYSNMYFYL